MRRKASICLAAACLASTVAAASFPRSLQQLASERQARQLDQPDIVFIFTDDQDILLDSLDYMPYLKKHMVDQGTSYTKHYCTVALCCPSRVSLLTGKAAHNTNVTDVTPPYGGYPKFVSQGLNDAYLPIWLQEAGYNTYYTGKLFNGHNLNNYNKPFPAGWTGSDFLLDPYTYQYYNATWQRNKEPPVSLPGQYSTDVAAQKSYGFLEEAIAAEKPFFLTMAPVGPHSTTDFGQMTIETIRMTPPEVADRHKDLFNDVVVPRTPNFNPDTPSGVSWIANLAQLNQSVIDYGDNWYRQRLRALQAVDEMIDGVFTRLSEANLLDNTYVFFSSDNGYHISQHRLSPGKECGFEEDINVPFVVRGPGIPQGETSDIVTSHTDLAPTFLTLANAQLRDDFDGAAISLRTPDHSESKSDTTRNEHVNIEFWGAYLPEGIFHPIPYINNTYKGLRLIGSGYSFYYSVWCNNEHELYDLSNDPYQLTNLYTTNHSTTSVSLDIGPSEGWTNMVSSTTQTVTLSSLIPRLDALLLILKGCKSTSCTHPWLSLHPSGNVHNLIDALDPQYDDYYEVELQDWRVSFSKCERGYIVASEGPQGQNAPAFDSLLDPRSGSMWSAMT